MKIIINKPVSITGHSFNMFAKFRADNTILSEDLKGMAIDLRLVKALFCNNMTPYIKYRFLERLM